MLDKINVCDSCKRSEIDPRQKGWLRITTFGITKYLEAKEGVAPGAYDFRNAKPLDFCNWRCFRKYWKGK